MLAQNLISAEIFALKKTDSCEAASILMADFKVKELPVVENAKVIGFVTEKALLNHTKAKVDSIMQLNTAVYCINHNTHIFDVLKALSEYNLSSASVTDNDNCFKGILTAADVLHYLYNNSALNQPGAVLVLQMPAYNYSLAEISRISESNDAKILHILVQPAKDTENHIQVSLKFNKTHLKPVQQSLERYGYQIIFANHTDEDDDAFNNRLNWLIK